MKYVIYNDRNHMKYGEFPELTIKLNYAKHTVMQIS